MLSLLVVWLSSVAVAQDAASLAGTWNVTSTPTGEGTCNVDPGAVTAYVWIVSANSNGTVSASVQGETGFPKLTGTFSGDSVKLTGPGTRLELMGGGVTDVSWFLLKRTADGMEGTRRFLGTTKATGVSGMLELYPCFVDYKVVAKR